MTSYPEPKRPTEADDRAPGGSWRRLVPRIGEISRGASNRPLSLALQGGGSFGAFTWGVLDRLLEAESLRLDLISGTSAGAINAVILADGIAEAGPKAARERLERFWRRISGYGPPAWLGQGVAGFAAADALEISARFASPYQFNPFDFNPLRDILADTVDFARLRAAPPVRLLIAATRVKDGRLRLFRENEITLEAVLASACLPLIHRAVEVDGEWYWDGGFSANPPLRELVIDTKASEILLVQVTPQLRHGLPRSSAEIYRRAGQIASNNLLQKEVDALADLSALCRKEGVFRSSFCRKLRQLRLHRITAEQAIDLPEHASALGLDWRFLSRLRESGNEAADRWMAEAAWPLPQ